jgi:pimeloyl-ACP methyl ester carboxylesterase
VTTYVLLHGAGDSSFYWHQVVPLLRARGHDVVAVDLPCDDESAGWADYTKTVVDAIGDRTDLVVVAQSFGGFTAPLVADRLPVRQIIMVAGMIPVPGECADDFWPNTHYDNKISMDDPIAVFYHDVPRELATEALAHGREQAKAIGAEPWPLARWPDVPVRCVVGRDDRFFPLAWSREVISNRLGITPDEIDGGHCLALARPHELVERLG